MNNGKVLIEYWRSYIENIFPDFKLIHNCFMESSPITFETKIGDVGEKALQRSIVKQKESNIDNIPIQWLDIELPIAQENKENRIKNLNRIDLIGSTLSRSAYAIVELKWGNCPDSPIEAMKQLLGYFYNVLYNKEQLEYQNIHHYNELHSWRWTNIELFNTRLIVAADKTYWRKYYKEIETLKALPSYVTFYEINIDDINYFKNQKGENAEYEPAMTSFENIWTRII